MVDSGTPKITSFETKSASSVCSEMCKNFGYESVCIDKSDPTLRSCNNGNLYTYDKKNIAKQKIDEDITKTCKNYNIKNNDDINHNCYCFERESLSKLEQNLICS